MRFIDREEVAHRLSYPAAAGAIAGRRTSDEITVYKSIGHIVQDLSTAWALYSGEL